MRCDFQLTGDTHKALGAVYRCANCGRRCYGVAAVYDYCGSSPAAAVPAPAEAACVYRGDAVGVIKKCGCASSGPAQVYVCSFADEQGERPHPFCTPHSLGVRAEWRHIPGVDAKPAACSMCKHRLMRRETA